MAKRVLITVGEVSGDTHAAELVRSLKKLDPSIQIDAIGGPRLAAAGANIIYESVGDAAMGLNGVRRTFEVLRLLKLLRRRYSDPSARPNLHICVDSSAMNLPFAKVAKSTGVPVMYYIAPQLWASREGRMKKLRRDVDRVACIFPFEESYFRSHGVNATFVGHPLFDELPSNRVNSFAPPRELKRDDAAVIGIIPGSRRSEVTANFGRLIEIARQIRNEFPDARFVIPTTAASNELVQRRLQATHLNATAALDGFDKLIPQCDLCLCKSGTSTLHVAAYGVPMVVVYHVNSIAWHLVGRWLVKSKKIAMVNILAGNAAVVPEFIPFNSIEPVAREALSLLRDRSKRAAQQTALREVIGKLNHPGASDRAAQMAIEMLG